MKSYSPVDNVSADVYVFVPTFTKFGIPFNVLISGGYFRAEAC